MKHALAGIALAFLFVFGLTGVGAFVDNQSATASTDLPLTVLSQTATKITVGWTPPFGIAGYEYKRDGSRVSNTWNPAAAKVTFSKPDSNQHVYEVDALTPAPSGSVTAPAPAPTTTAPVTTTQPVTTTSPVTTTTPGTANVFLSPTGNDSTCSRGGTPCQTFNQADQLAQDGDTIQVAPGAYSGSANYGYTNSILTSTKVTFVCQPGAAADSVSTADPGFLIGPGGGNVTFTGSCFHFHVIAVGLRGYDSGGSPINVVHDVILDGVHMDSFDITGARNVTVKNSQVGPIDDCYGSGHGSADCDPNNPVEAYWASVGGTTDLQGEPFVHNNGPDPATNVVFDHDRFTGMQTKDPNFFHQGGLLVWDTQGLQITNTTWDHNAIYDIEENADSFDSGMVLSGNSFGQPVYTLADSTPGAPLPDSWQDVTLGGYGIALSNATISSNTFVNGLGLSQGGTGWSYSNVQVTGNQLGTNPSCGVPGVTYTANTSC